MVNVFSSHWMRKTIIVLLILSVLVIVAPAPEKVQASTCTLYHRVRWGENLFRIGLRYGVPWTTLMTWNGLTSTRIYAGQYLCVAQGVPPTPIPGPVCHQYHTVQWGENLYRIGLMYGQSWVTLMFWNRIWNPNRIYVGQVLCVSYY